MKQKIDYDDLRGNLKILADIVGMEKIHEILEKLDGTNMYIGFKKHRNNYLKRMLTEDPQTIYGFSKKYKVSPNTIYKLKKELKNEK